MFDSVILSYIAIVLSLFGAIAIVLMAYYCRLVNRRLSKSIELVSALHDIVDKQAQKLNNVMSSVPEQLNRLEQSKAEKVNLFEEHLQQHQADWSGQLSKINQRIDTFEAKLDAQAQQDPAAKMYNKANKLLQEGASDEDIMQACELPRAEVQILRDFHRKRSMAE